MFTNCLKIYKGKQCMEINIWQSCKHLQFILNWTCSSIPGYLDLTPDLTHKWNSRSSFTGVFIYHNSVYSLSLFIFLSMNHALILCSLTGIKSRFTHHVLLCNAWKEITKSYPNWFKTFYQRIVILFSISIIERTIWQHAKVVSES